MNRYRGLTFAATPLTSPLEAGKLKRKLQKVSTPQRSFPAKRSENGAFKSLFYNSKSGTVHEDTSEAQPILLAPPDLSDPTWTDFVRKNGILDDVQPKEPSVSFAKLPERKPSKRRPARKPSEKKLSSPVVPEFAHLGLQESRESLGHVSTSSSALRRYAKTPILRVGQLEDVTEQEDPAEENSAEENLTDNIEVIAEQYRALVHSRSMMFPGSPAPSLYEDAMEELRARTPYIPSGITKERLLEIAESPSPSLTSPDSDGTLVEFEEDATYYKPMSFTPERQADDEESLRTPDSFTSESTDDRVSSLAPDNFSLQICLDLLTRDLSSALPENEVNGLASETEALQVWAMIEAYEKLQDKMMGMNLNDQQRQPLKGMFDMWLQALYNVHDKMTGNDTQYSESLYDD